jgi:predicted transcriptional regulator
MKRYKIQSLASLEEEMRTVARGERAAPADAARPSFNSVAALVRLLTPENRRLLALIRHRKPGSVAELARLTGRAQPNLRRTLRRVYQDEVGRPPKSAKRRDQEDRGRDRSVLGERSAARGLRRAAKEGLGPILSERLG